MYILSTSPRDEPQVSQGSKLSTMLPMGAMQGANHNTTCTVFTFTEVRLSFCKNALFFQVQVNGPLYISEVLLES